MQIAPGTRLHNYMASKRTKIIAASVIWIGVAAGAWHAYANILPKYGIIQRKTNQSMGPRAWQEMRKDIEEFQKEPVPSSIELTVTRIKDNEQPGGMSDIRTVKGGYFAYISAGSVANIYAQLSGISSWQVAQPPGAAPRYTVKIKAPAAMKAQIPKHFLDYLKWKTKESVAAREGVLLTEGSPPANPAAASTQARRGGTWGSMPLSAVSGMIASRVQGPVEVAPSVANKKPPAEIRVDWNLPPGKFVDQIASHYGVAVQRKSMDTSLTLVYHPKYIKQEDLNRWLKDGKF